MTEHTRGDLVSDASMRATLGLPNISVEDAAAQLEELGRRIAQQPTDRRHDDPAVLHKGEGADNDA